MLEDFSKCLDSQFTSNSRLWNMKHFVSED